MCFNGAVTFSLRKFPDTAVTEKETEELQWGRNFFVTEIRLQTIKKEEKNMLQWGRNFFVTEITIIGQTHTYDYIASMGP